MYMDVLPAYHMCVWFLERPEEDTGEDGTGVGTVVSCHADAGDQTWSFARTASALNN